MPIVDPPSSPVDEVAARRAWTGPTPANGVLTGDLVAFCQSGVSVVIASCDRDGRPVVGRGLACRVDETGRVRLVIRSESNLGLLQAIAQGRGLAVTFTRPSTHRSIQLKASCAQVVSSEPLDGPSAEFQTAALRANLVEEGYWEDFAAQYCAFEPAGLSAIQFVPEHAFVQTPGPGAGSPLRP